MKSSEVIGIIVCLLLVLSVAGCTDSSKPPPETVSTENIQITNQPTQSSITEQSTPAST